MLIDVFVALYKRFFLFSKRFYLFERERERERAQAGGGAKVEAGFLLSRELDAELH